MNLYVEDHDENVKIVEVESKEAQGEGNDDAIEDAQDGIANSYSNKVFLYLEEILHSSDQYVQSQKGIFGIINKSFNSLWEFVVKVISNFL